MTSCQRPPCMNSPRQSIVRRRPISSTPTKTRSVRVRQRERPRFKPSWSPELLLAENYIGRLSLMRRELVSGSNGFRNGFDGAEEWDLLLRLSRRTKAITRLPLCLYHRAAGARGGPSRRREQGG